MDEQERKEHRGRIAGYQEEWDRASDDAKEEVCSQLDIQEIGEYIHLDAFGSDFDLECLVQTWKEIRDRVVHAEWELTTATVGDTFGIGGDMDLDSK